MVHVNVKKKIPTCAIKFNSVDIAIWCVYSPYADIYGAFGVNSPMFLVLHTCHSYGVYEEYFILIAQVDKLWCCLKKIC